MRQPRYYYLRNRYGKVHVTAKVHGKHLSRPCSTVHEANQWGVLLAYKLLRECQLPVADTYLLTQSASQTTGATVAEQQG